MSRPANELLSAVAARLGPDWTADPDPFGPPGAAYITHLLGHRIGIRYIGPVLQTWITAGPFLDLPETGDPRQDATALTARNARLQEGRSWHLTIRVNHVDDLEQALLHTLRDHLIRALLKKPRRVLILQPAPTPERKPAPTESAGPLVPTTTPTARKPAPRRTPKKRPK
ncbi:hypothetical protein [Streptomyces antibioticus]|uniref:hypothetical protein n=1 Tax=Streptomyces antibioticus TaxID=1890 RepID=UPI003D757ECD